MVRIIFRCLCLAEFGGIALWLTLLACWVSCTMLEGTSVWGMEFEANHCVHRTAKWCVALICKHCVMNTGVDVFMMCIKTFNNSARNKVNSSYLFMVSKQSAETDVSCTKTAARDCVCWAVASWVFVQLVSSLQLPSCWKLNAKNKNLTSTWTAAVRLQRTVIRFSPKTLRVNKNFKWPFLTRVHASMSLYTTGCTGSRWQCWFMALF